MFFEKLSKKEEGAIRSYDISSKKVRVAYVVILVVCILMVVFALFPFVWAILSSFKDVGELRNSSKLLPNQFDLNGLVGTWNDLKFGKYYLNSIISAAGSIVCAVLFNGILAYVLAILKPAGHKIIFALVMSTLLIPPTTSIVSLFANINRIGLTDSYLPLWLSMGANAFWVVLFKQFFESLPISYIEAARLDGCGDVRVFSHIVLPLSKPIIVVIAIFALTAAWSDFLLPYLVTAGTAKETVMVRLFAFRTSIKVNDSDILRAATFAIIPPTLIFIAFQKQITSGIAAGGIKG